MSDINMQIKIYNSLPKEASDIRTEVFINEQGFENEYDSIDETATHIVMFIGDMPVATCRVFWNAEMNSYVLGRLAVLKEHRGNNIGASVVEEAENHVRKTGKKQLMLHAQCRITGFYKKLGYKEFGDVEYEEDCPHIWMKKEI